MKSYIKALRPEQWYKNLVVFVALLFASEFFSWSSWYFSILTFLAFCMLSSAGYIINDIHDVEKDKQHPTKKNRPITSGKVKIRYILPFSGFLLLGGLTIAGFVNELTLLISIGYSILTIVYTLFLKPYHYIGLTTLGIGFVIRTLAGCTALEVEPSGWVISCIFIFALMLMTAKRKHEGTQELAIALIFIYGAYTFYQSPFMIISVIPAAYAVLRYIHLKPKERSPESLLKDKYLVGTLIIWLITVGSILILTK